MVVVFQASSDLLFSPHRKRWRTLDRASFGLIRKSTNFECDLVRWSDISRRIKSAYGILNGIPLLSDQSGFVTVVLNFRVGNKKQKCSWRLLWLPRPFGVDLTCHCGANCSSNFYCRRSTMRHSFTWNTAIFSQSSVTWPLETRSYWGSTFP